MLAIKCSLLNREYVLIIALKALVSIVFICSLHVIFLSNLMLMSLIKVAGKSKSKSHYN
jgi:hypothetical protein